MSCGDDHLMSLMSSPTWGQEFLQTNNTRKDQSELGHDEGLSSEESESPEGQRHHHTSDEQGDGEEGSELLSSAAGHVCVDFGAIVSWEFDLELRWVWLSVVINVLVCLRLNIKMYLSLRVLLQITK